VHFPGRSRWRQVASAATLAVVLASCAVEQHAPQDTFKPESDSARRITRLATPVFAIAIGVGVFVYALLAWCIIKYRRRDDDHVPVQVHGNGKLEAMWGLIPALVLVVVGLFSVPQIFHQAREPKDAYNITVIGHQWWWEYQYPQIGQTKMSPKLVSIPDPLDIDKAKKEGRTPKLLAKVIEQTGPVITTANELHVPAGRNIRLIISSADVMHNYWVPKLAGKIYAIPGRLNRLTLNSDANDAGKTIFGQCAEFCGTSHANMRFKVKIDSPADFDAWLARQTQPASTPTTDLAKAGEALFKGGGGCTGCHWTDSSRTNGFEAVKATDGSVSYVKNIGPNLSHFGLRKTFAGATADANTRNLKAWLRNPQEFKPGSKMVIRKLSEDEVNQLVAYVQSLK
jgi:cytochrome c oxidase subunit II